MRGKSLGAGGLAEKRGYGMGRSGVYGFGTSWVWDTFVRTPLSWLHFPRMPDTRTRLLALLAASDHASQEVLARRLGVSVRTIRRHLRALETDGTACSSRDGLTKRYRLAPHAHPVAPAPDFTEGEMEALAVAALAARAVLAPTPLAAVLDDATAKLRTDWLARAISFEAETDAALWSFDGATGGQPPDAAPALFRDLLAAIRHQNPVRADYYTASRDVLTPGRRLAPLGFLVRSGAWLVAAVDLDADDRPVKDFALAGFQRLERMEDEHVPPPPDFDLALFARDRFGALAGEVELVRLLVEAEAVPYFKRRMYNPTQQIEEERADGRAVVSFEAGGLDAVKAWVLSWGAKVRVLEPDELAERVAEAHRAAVGRYVDA